MWKPISSDRSDNNCWDRTFPISANVVAAIAGEWWLWSLRSLNFLGSEFHIQVVTPFHDIVFIVPAVALIINNRPGISLWLLPDLERGDDQTVNRHVGSTHLRRFMQVSGVFLANVQIRNIKFSKAFKLQTLIPAVVQFWSHEARGI